MKYFLLSSSPEIFPNSLVWRTCLYFHKNWRLSTWIPSVFSLLDLSFYFRFFSCFEWLHVSCLFQGQPFSKVVVLHLFLFPLWYVPSVVNSLYAIFSFLLLEPILLFTTHNKYLLLLKSFIPFILLLLSSLWNYKVVYSSEVLCRHSPDSYSCPLFSELFTPNWWPLILNYNYLALILRHFWLPCGSWYCWKPSCLLFPLYFFISIYPSQLDVFVFIAF